MAFCIDQQKSPTPTQFVPYGTIDCWSRFLSEWAATMDMKIYTIFHLVVSKHGIPELGKLPKLPISESLQYRNPDTLAAAQAVAGILSTGNTSFISKSVFLCHVTHCVWLCLPPNVSFCDAISTLGQPQGSWKPSVRSSGEHLVIKCSDWCFDAFSS